MMPSSGALQGIRVLDLSRVLAGPLCSMMLGDLGADVIKVESFQGDDTRNWGPPWKGTGDDAESAYYLSINRNKRSIVVNLKDPAGAELIRDLADQSHILLENFRPGKTRDFGLDWRTLSTRNPALVYCSITGFGQVGPYRDRPGYDYVIQAMSGLMSITGPIDAEPARVGVPISDVLAGLFAANSILAALRHSEQTGSGQYLDVSLLDSQLAALVNVAGGFLVEGIPPRRFGNQHPHIVPYQVFQAADRALVVAAGNNRQFQHLCQVIKRPELASDHRFSKNSRRVKNREVLVRELSRQFGTRPAQEWVKALLAMGVPAGPIQNVAEAIEDPHIRSRQLVQELDGFKSLRYPVHLSETDPELRRKPPRLGEHTFEVLQELLGLSPARLGELTRQGAIWSHTDSPSTEFSRE